MRRAIIHISSWTNGSFGSSAETDRLEESRTVTFLIFGFCSFFFFLGMEMLGKSFVDLSFILIFFSSHSFCFVTVPFR